MSPGDAARALRPVSQRRLRFTYAAIEDDFDGPYLTAVFATTGLYAASHMLLHWHAMELVISMFHLGVVAAVAAAVKHLIGDSEQHKESTESNPEEPRRVDDEGDDIALLQRRSTAKQLWAAFHVVEHCARALPSRCVALKHRTLAACRRFARTLDHAAREPKPAAPEPPASCSCAAAVDAAALVKRRPSDVS